MNREINTIDCLNHPFTRWEKLPLNYRAQLLSSFRRIHPRYLVRGWNSLQILAMLLIDGILEKVVLSLPSFRPQPSTPYRPECKKLLRERYHVSILAEGSDLFSEESGFKELVMVARKGQEDLPRTGFAFCYLITWRCQLQAFLWIKKHGRTC